MAVSFGETTETILQWFVEASERIPLSENEKEEFDTLRDELQRNVPALSMQAMGSSTKRKFFEYHCIVSE